MSSAYKIVNKSNGFNVMDKFEEHVNALVKRAGLS